MRIDLEEAGVGPDLPPLTLALAPGVPTAIAVETDERPKLLSLLIGGRLRPTTGRVTIDDVDRRAALRDRVALVDTPFASEPSPVVALRVAVTEELAFAGRPSGRRAVAALLARHGLADAARTPVALVPPADRIRLLAELALERDGIEALVVTSPERHGGDPADWYPALESIAARGLVVAIVTDRATASALLRLGATAPHPDREPV